MKDDFSVYNQLKEHPSYLKYENLIGDLFVFLIAGFDTIAHQMASSTYFLHKYPVWREKIKTDCDRIFGGDMNNLKREHLDEIDSVTWFLKES